LSTLSNGLFPPLEPIDQGWLDVGDGHRIFYEQCGTPLGVPVLFLHGGPGSGINANHRRFFDPAHYRIVLFDQRGCGRSTPRGETSANTTADLVQDMERLRAHLQIDRWMLFGGSWGSTLALAYAQRHVGRVMGMVLRGVYLGSRPELDWFLMGLRRFLPDAWAAFSAGVPTQSAQAMVHWFARQAERGDLFAAKRWGDYESAVMAVGEAPGGGAAVDEAALQARVRVQLHYLIHDCFLQPDELLAGMPRIAHLPAIIVQGRRDLPCPPLTAHQLHAAWPGSQLRLVEEGGHSALNPAIAAALVRATEDMKTLAWRAPA
jgi:proline iminopeptidase